MYSRGIWGHYFTKRFGRDAMRRTWEGFSASPPVNAIDNVLRSSYQSNLRAAFAEWPLWNYFTAGRADAARYYNEGKNYPVMAETVYDVPSGTRDMSGAVGCLASKYYRIASGRDTVAVVVTYVGTGCPTDAASQPFTVTASRTRPDDSYRPASGGFYLKLTAADPSGWVVWDIGAGGIGGPYVNEGSSFPSPFRPAQSPLVYLRSEAAEGTLSVYTSDMVLVFTEHQSSRTYLGQRVFVWNGRNLAGEDARSGVYLFVVHANSGTVTGKLALVR
jgi:hypothetical protein